eukprot:364690-Chlamydomonas_euryale.AAC.11
MPAAAPVTSAELRGAIAAAHNNTRRDDERGARGRNAIGHRCRKGACAGCCECWRWCSGGSGLGARLNEAA